MRARFDSFVRTVKEYILLYCEAAGLPGSLLAREKRAELERKNRGAYMSAYEWWVTEEPAQNAKARFQVLEVLANLARTERPTRHACNYS